MIRMPMTINSFSFELYFDFVFFSFFFSSFNNVKKDLGYKIAVVEAWLPIARV